MSLSLVIFDIGGVLALIDKKPLNNILSTHSNNKLFFNRDFFLFQRGLITTKNFFNKKASELDICPHDLELSFTHIIQVSPQASCINYLTVPYLFASNINKLHYKNFLKKIKASSFARNNAVLSYRLGLLKPHPRFFIYMLNKAKIKAKQIAYIDDQENNIFEAKKAGFVARLCETPESLPSILFSLKILAAANINPKKAN